jgi:hypothetical protein
MSLPLYQRVALKRDLPEQGLKRGMWPRWSITSLTLRVESRGASWRFQHVGGVDCGGGGPGIRAREPPCWRDSGR